ncbi:ERF family protein [Paracoccus sp. AS002]|uniref:ERF family protein n=1 Tax=Paracoccus sp. AS002 TaxID=3019545 RepID=UPI0023E8C13F|nr:ERF family protein [Paracoccus sp. AS002]MDF3904658.1 ERF family protein [Paracoccus sp. AS002]
MTKTVHDVLAEIQAKIAVPKGRKSEFGGYAYRKAEDIIAAFRSCGIVGASLVLTDRLAEIGGQIFVVATARLAFGGDVVASEGCAMHALTKKGMDASQITGSASSYARKYALQGLFALDDGEHDPDSKDNRKENGNDPAAQAIEYINEAETNEDLLRAWENLPENVKDLVAVKAAYAKRYRHFNPKKDAA